MIDVNSTTATRPVEALRTRAGTKVAVRDDTPVSQGTDENGKRPPVDGRNLPAASAGADQATGRASEPPDLERLAESLADFARKLNRDLSFSVHEASGRTVVTVLDGETREVIRQIPSEEVLRLSEALAESRGLLLDRKA